MDAPQKARNRGEFNSDIRAMFSAEQLQKLKSELGIKETPEDKAMPALKDEMRKKIVRDLAQKNSSVKQDDIQGLLRANAAKDVNEEPEII